LYKLLLQTEAVEVLDELVVLELPLGLTILLLVELLLHGRVPVLTEVLLLLVLLITEIVLLLL
jgi:hypothetical protein